MPYAKIANLALNVNLEEWYRSIIKQKKLNRKKKEKKETIAFISHKNIYLLYYSMA